MTDLNHPDTSQAVVNTNFKSNVFPLIFEAAFQKDTKAKQGNNAYELYNFDIGKIKIESGKIIACDPIITHDAYAFTQIFPVGEFPVQLAMAKSENDERVAFSRILFTEDSVARWEFALKPGQEPIPLGDTSFYCYGVDAGPGIFIDSIANVFLNKKNQSEWDRIFIKKAEVYGYRGYIHHFEEHSLATFSTGYGDGCYATYVGYNKDGNICRLLTDFDLFRWWTPK